MRTKFDLGRPDGFQRCCFNGTTSLLQGCFNGSCLCRSFAAGIPQDWGPSFCAAMTGFFHRTTPQLPGPLPHKSLLPGEWCRSFAPSYVFPWSKYNWEHLGMGDKGNWHQDEVRFQPLDVLKAIFTTWSSVSHEPPGNTRIKLTKTNFPRHYQQRCSYSFMNHFWNIFISFFEGFFFVFWIMILDFWSAVEQPVCFFVSLN